MTAVAFSPDVDFQPNDADRWRAVQSRDASADGAFVYAVTSTGIYCRPGCPSRRPARENVRFFDSPADAAHAGYRACLRCEPDRAPTPSATDAGVAAARRHLDANPDRVVSLGELASHAGLSVSHLQRAFKRIIGLSPREYQATQRARRLRARLRDGDTVSRASFDAGYGSSSRVYENADAMLGMTPATIRRRGQGARIWYTIADAPIGRVLVATTDRGVCAVEIGGTDAEVEERLRSDFPKATIERDDERHAAWVRAALDAVRAPDRASGDIALDLDGTDFQLRVWAALRRIPAGERRSYREVAESIGEPTASRAVARACATNRVAIVVPCHRVVRGDGALSGYKWGAELKQRLLDAESGRPGTLDKNTWRFPARTVESLDC